MKIVVIGASASGLKAACRSKRLMPETQISVFDRGEHISYGACGLPYYLSGDLENIEALMMTPFGVKRTPEFFQSAKDLNVQSSVSVENIDAKRKVVSTINLKTGETTEVSYDKLVIASGATPFKPDIPGIDSDKIDFFKYVDDALKLRKLVEGGKISNVGIVGTGFIGCELADSFYSMWGCDVSMFETHDQILPAFLDIEMSGILENYLEGEGIDVYTGIKITSFEDSGDKIAIHTNNGDKFEFDRVLVAVGVSPETTLAKEAGLKIGPSGGIVVDENLLTSDKDIYAAGDCVEKSNSITGELFNIPLGSLANRQGRVVGSNLAGSNEKFKPVTSSFAVKVFDYNISATGLTEKAARKAGLKVDAQWGTFNDSAEYYPESKNIFLKLVFDPDSRKVLGFQGLGPGETVKRTDVLTSLIRNNGTVDDIFDLEFAYAPPYAPPLDPLFSIAAASLNHLDHANTGVNPNTDIKKVFDQVVDVRMREEAEKSPIDHPNVINIPLTEIRSRIDELPQKGSILVVCAKGSRSSESVCFLKKAGLCDIKYLGGGLLMFSNN